MKNIQHHNRGVIPDYMLDRLAEHADSKETARDTLQATSALAIHRDRAENAPPLAQPVKKRRSVYDAQNQRRLPGRLVMSEHKARTENDLEVNQAYDGTGRAYDFMNIVFGRSSVDGRGMRLVSTVHYGVRYINAMWDGRQMIFGDGDPKVFYPFTRSLDVTCHEVAHGLTQFTAGLGYSGQTGALNEHVSDVIGSVAKQWVLNQTAEEADWTIGRDLFRPGINAIGIRSLALPGSAYDDPHLGKDPQPAHMRDYVETKQDNGGVHVNSSIPNNAFYRGAMRIGGRTSDIIVQIWYVTLTERISSDAEFNDFAAATVDVAREKYSRDVMDAVAAGWAEVGLPVSPSATASHFSMVPRPADRKPKPAAKKWRRRPAA